MSTRVAAALVVEDHAALRRTLERALEAFAERVVSAGTVTDGLRLLADEQPQLVVTDVRLPDGSGIELARAASLVHPLPVLVAMSGEATPDEAFRLAQYGARGYLTKPLQLAELSATLRNALDEPPELATALRASVGKVDLLEFEGSVRQTLLDEALAKSGGNKARAASLRSVSRQLLQHMLRGR